MARNETHFEYADHGPVSVYKFRVGDDPQVYLWFRMDDGSGSLHTTGASGPYHAEDPVGPAGYDGLDALLHAKGTTRAQWTEDLMAQYGERVGWNRP